MNITMIFNGLWTPSRIPQRSGRVRRPEAAKMKALDLYFPTRRLVLASSSREQNILTKRPYRDYRPKYTLFFSYLSTKTAPASDPDSVVKWKNPR